MDCCELICMPGFRCVRQKMSRDFSHFGPQLPEIIAFIFFVARQKCIDHRQFFHMFTVSLLSVESQKQTAIPFLFHRGELCITDCKVDLRRQKG